MLRLLAVLVLLAVGGCGDAPSPTAPNQPPPHPDSDRDGIHAEADSCPDEPETVNQWRDDDGCPDDTSEFYDLVSQDVESYWDAVFTNSGFTYTPIQSLSAYQTNTSTGCGHVGSDNAFYCPSDLGVYYHQPFLDDYWIYVGDMAPAFIVGHEIGHHVSFQLGWFNNSWSQAFPQIPHTVISDKQLELQADCFAGAWTQWADTRQLLETGDLDEAVEALISVGDQGIPWFSPLGHGTAEQRLIAFAAGFSDGPSACESTEFFTVFPVSAADGSGINRLAPEK